LYVVALPGVKERNARGYAVIHHGPQQLTAHSLLELLVTHRQVEPVDLLTAEPATNNKTAAESLPRSPDQTWYPTHDAANKARGTTTLKPRTKLCRRHPVDRRVLHHPEETQQPQHTQTKLEHQHKRKNPPHQLTRTQTKQAIIPRILKPTTQSTEATLLIVSRHKSHTNPDTPPNTSKQHV